MAQQTAVKWLLENIQKVHKMDWDIVFVQAMMIEKEQIINAWRNGNLPTPLGRVITEEEYYNETYNNDLE
jgi:hypothetical protein